MRPRAGLLLCLCAALLPGCLSSVVWYGKSPDRRRAVRVVEQCDAQFLELDGEEGPDFEGVGVEGVTFSPDSRRLAYPARVDGGWTAVVDGHRGEVWDGIGPAAWSPDGEHIAYAAERGSAWRVVHDGRPGPPFESILKGSLMFSPDSRRLAYGATRGPSAFAVIDGTLSRAYEGIGAMHFSANGARVAYIASRGGEALAVIDGVESPPYEVIAEFSLSPDSTRRAVVARRLQKGEGNDTGDDGWWVIIGAAEAGASAAAGSEAGPFDRVSSVVWSRGGGHVAFAAKRGTSEVVYKDGAPGPAFDSILPKSIAFDAAGERFAYAATRGGRAHVVLDGAPGPAFDEVTAPVLAERGGGFGYVGRRGRSSVAVINGRTGPDYDWIGAPVLAPDGARHAYLARRGPKTLLVHGAGAIELDLAVEGTLVFSRDGRHFACLTGDARARSLFIAIDGTRRRPFDGEELFAAMARRAEGGGDSKDAFEGMIRRWVAAELEIALRE